MADPQLPIAPTPCIAKPSLTGLGGSQRSGGAGGASLQNLLNQVGTPGVLMPGDTIVCTAGVTYSPILLPARSDAGWIAIVSSAQATLPVGTTVTAANAGAMFTIQSTVTNTSCIKAWSTTQGWIFAGCRVTSTVFQQAALVQLQSFDGVSSLSTTQPSRFVFDRCLWAGVDTVDQRKGVDLMAYDCRFVDCAILGIRDTNSDSQAIFANGGGRNHIEHCELQGAGENILLGDGTLGNGPPWAQSVNDITIIRNHFFKPYTWRQKLPDGTTSPTYDGVFAQCKNLFEIKWAKRVLLEGNILEHCWPFQGDQPGQWAFVHAGPSDSTDIMIRSNKVLESTGGITLAAHPEIVNNPMWPGGTFRLQRVALLNNLFYVGGRAVLFNRGGTDVWIEHNTGFPMRNGQFPLYPGIGQDEGTMVWTNVVPQARLLIRRNVFGKSTYGIFFDGAADPNTQFTNPALFTELTRAENALYGPESLAAVTGFKYFSIAASGVNVADGTLASNSPLKVGGADAGSDGQDLGVNFTTLQQAIDGVQGIPNSSFSYTQTPGTLTVVFTNTSSGGPDFTAHAWTFFATNGTSVLGTSAAEHPSFLYPASGSYNVRHQVSNITGPGTIVNSAIQVNPIPATPTLTITGPTAAATWPVSSPTITLTGSSTDMTGGTWVNDRGGNPGSGVLTGTNPWSTPVITLAEGANVLTILPTNSGLNGTADVLTVTYTPPAPIAGDPPFWQAAGAIVAGVGGVSAGWPAHQTGDIGWLFVGTANEAVATPAGFGVVLNSPQGLGTAGAAGATRISVFWKRAASAAEAAVSITDPGSHVVAVLVTTRGGIATGDPWDVTAGDTLTPANTTITFPPVTTTVPQCLMLCADAFDGIDPNNLDSNWSGLGGFLGSQRRVVAHTYLGTDTGFAIGSGTKAAAGATAAMTTGSDAATIQARLTIAVRGVPAGTVVPPTVALAVSAGSPSTGVPWQVTATTTGPVDRVEFDVNAVLTETRTVAPYQFFDAATGLLGAGTHTIVARVYDTPGGTADDTATLIVTEPTPTAGTWLIERELCDRVPGADSYNLYTDNVFVKNVLQPETGNPVTTFPITGADTTKLHEVTSVTAAVESARAPVRVRYADPSATAPEGIKELSRAYAVGANLWTVIFRVERKGLAISYNPYLDGSLGTSVLQPASGRPTFTFTFTGASVEKVFGFSAVFTGPVEGPRASVKDTFVAPAAGAPTGGQELSRVFTP